MLTDTLIPTELASEASCKLAILRCTSIIDFGASIVAAPRYLTPAKIVQS